MYVPPEQSRFFNDDEFYDFQNDISVKCSKYETVLITGDSNGHTSTLPDYLEFDDFLSSYLNVDDATLDSFNQINKLEKLNIPRDRLSQCSKINNNGKKFLEICKNNNLFILNGRFSCDKSIGKCTFRGKTVIDYSIATINCILLLNEFDIIELDSLFSDGHCLLSMNILIPMPELPHVSPNEPSTRTSQNKLPKWDDSNPVNSWKILIYKLCKSWVLC
jgi:hypothetical protein